jgi:hypothetical protein
MQFLTADQKQQHVSVHKGHRQIVSGDAILLSRVMTQIQSNIPPNGEVKSKIKNMLVFLTSWGLFTKNPSWQVKQSILHTTVTL